jgi:molybdenum cofactor cytidylyltransferase
MLRLLGAHAETILKRPCPAGVGTFVHPGWEQGIGSSLAAGVSRLMEICPDLDAVFVLLADQPMVTVGLLGRMQAGLRMSSVVCCEGPPALFARSHFEELQALQGDRGAKAVAANHPATVVPFPDAAWDIDSPAAWAEFLAADFR